MSNRLCERLQGPHAVEQSSIKRKFLRRVRRIVLVNCEILEPRTLS